MFKYLYSRLPFLLLVIVSFVACNRTGEVYPETAELVATQPVTEDDDSPANQVGEGAEPVEESPAETALLSFAGVGQDPEFANVQLSGEFDAPITEELPTYYSAPATSNEAQATALLQIFGIESGLYTTARTGESVFYAFDGSYQIEIFPSHIQLTALQENRFNQPTFSASEVTALAEKQLAQWAWPDFEYEIVPRSNSTAEVRRMVQTNEGYKSVNAAEMTMRFDAAGKLASFLLSIPDLQASEVQPVISAEEALAKLESLSFVEEGIQFELAPDGVVGFQPAQPLPLTSWRNNYPAGSRVNLTGTVAEYLPTVAGEPILIFDRFKLAGGKNMIDSLRQHGTDLATIFGTVGPDGGTLAVDVWEPANLTPSETSAPLSGVLRQEGDEVFLDNSRLGNGYVLIDPPVGVPDGSEVIVYQNFYFSDADGRYIEWNLIELQNRNIVPQPEPTAIFQAVSAITITKMELAYGKPAFGSEPSLYYTPIWKVYGETDTRLAIVFYIPASK